MFTRRHMLSAAAGTALAAGAFGRASAQAWPTRFVRLIVPFPPGGGTDAVGRILSTRLSEIWGQQVVIENRGGAGSNIGTEAAARAEPDGYTMLFSSLPHAINKFIYRALPYDPVADFAPITLICHFPNLLVVPNSSPAKSVADLIALGKERDGKMTFASSGIGTSPHLCGELFKRLAGFEMTHVPYRGAGPALTDVIAGRVDMMFNTMGALLPQARSGQVRGLAVSTTQRFPTAPEFPPVAEALPGFEVSAWYALFAPAKTPPEIVRRMNADAVTALRDPAVITKLEALGVLVAATSQEELSVFLKSEMDKWGPVIRAAGISAN